MTSTVPQRSSSQLETKGLIGTGRRAAGGVEGGGAGEGAGGGGVWRWAMREIICLSLHCQQLE